MVGNCTVMVRDNAINEFRKARVLELRHRLLYLERLNDSMYPYDISVADYKKVMDIKPNAIDYACSFDGDRFSIEQTGWYKGLPLVTVTPYWEAEEDSD